MGAVATESLTSANWVTQDKLSSLTGFTAKALERKRQRGVLPEGEVWALIDGRIMYSIQGYNQWVEKQVSISFPQVSKSMEASSGSHSSGKVKGAGSRFKSRRHPRASSAPAVLELR